MAQTNKAQSQAINSKAAGPQSPDLFRTKCYMKLNVTINDRSQITKFTNRRHLPHT